MSDDGWKTVLVLGGIRSGKSGYAESLVDEAATVRYVATGAFDPDDPEWAARIEAHRARRSERWHTEEAAEHPGRLIELISAAAGGETLLIDDLGGWVTVLLDPAHQPADDRATIADLAAAVRASAARLVLVSPEVGLALVPTTPVGRAFADALGATNQALAAVCDSVVLVIAGQPVEIKAGGPDGPDGPLIVPVHAGARPTTSIGETALADPAPADSTAVGAAAADRTEAAPVGVDQTAGSTGSPPATIEEPSPITPGMALPMPAEKVGVASTDRLGRLDQPGAGFGALARIVAFAAATQDTPTPRPWDAVRVILVHGDHDGGVAAGDSPLESARRAEQARTGVGPLAYLAAAAGADVTVVTAPTAAAIEEGAALPVDDVETALATGWRTAEQAARDGAQAIVIAACGAGSAAAAAAVLAATTGAEPAAVLGRVHTSGGLIDDNAWMTRCAAVRDALHRTRRGTRSAREVLAEFGGGDIAVATGVLLGATANRIPVLVDGPVGVAAGLVSRDLAGQARHWCLLPDHGRQPTVRHAADVLGLTPLLDLRLDLGEGVTSLAALPMLRSTLALAGALGERPVQAAATDDADAALGQTDDGGPVLDDTDTDTDAAIGRTGGAAGDATGGDEPGTNPTGTPENGYAYSDEQADDQSEVTPFIEPEPAGPGPAKDTDRR
ncbi:bifunctional adenosylcobinamide kinase/adenosylcobinamide-phosphate guanylyltransferase [Solwaraspora sp. WMMD406]|uniref:bifunctional adenosylcobinamide kinase/adenosylcobinamide-phosphate guanylyltransferase n=1 Tax=Solwaraspora sp. WMMD406 TaxID=3016095 RepID=UPI0024174376|nr:bifunctional adenosylcobinamide kinase/adenosylcobinamide-phosphate guanylyltransferase [Solwaraspora sp. WMMD406]MDG4765128.1 bifunctional adenosylcobinamide kinase/adenosylcobinamide-phosphate guanylyltransferase [Solwaraspora sp. WMMD406]